MNQTGPLGVAHLRRFCTGTPKTTLPVTASSARHRAGGAAGAEPACAPLGPIDTGFIAIESAGDAHARGQPAASSGRRPAQTRVTCRKLVPRLHQREKRFRAPFDQQPGLFPLPASALPHWDTDPDFDIEYPPEALCPAPLPAAYPGALSCWCRACTARCSIAPAPLWEYSLIEGPRQRPVRALREDAPRSGGRNGRDATAPRASLSEEPAPSAACRSCGRRNGRGWKRARTTPPRADPIGAFKKRPRERSARQLGVSSQRRQGTRAPPSRRISGRRKSAWHNPFEGPAVGAEYEGHREPGASFRAIVFAGAHQSRTARSSARQ